MADYTVKIGGQGSGGPWTFTVPPGLLFSGARTHRRDVYPEEHAVTDYTVRLERCRVFSVDGTASAAATALAAFFTACLHGRAKPTYLQILDGASPIAEIGDMNTSTTGWQEILVTEWAMDDDAAQLRAGATFSLTITARRTFVDANGLVMLERDFRSRIGSNGLEVRTLTSRVQMRALTAVPTSASWLLALVRLAKPTGWVRSAGGSGGIQVSYPLGATRTDVAEIVSEVSQRGVSLPANAGGGTTGTTRRDRPELGLVEVTRFAELEGDADIAAFLRGQAPAGSTGERTHDEGDQRGRGAWTTWELAGQVLGGKVTRLVVERRLTHGGGRVTVSERSGNLLPQVRKGAVAAWRLEERITVFALGVTEWSHIPTLPPLEKPWVVDPAGGSDEGPRVDQVASTVDQTRWVRITARTYVWDGDHDPLEDEKVRTMLTTRYVVGELGGVTLT